MKDELVFLKNHEYENRPSTVQVVDFCHGGKDPIRKLVIAKEIAKEKDVKALCVAAKNGVVYAAVKNADGSVSCRIYDTSVFRNGGDMYMKYTCYSEEEYMPIEKYEFQKDQLESAASEEERQKVQEKINQERLTYLPPKAHAKVLNLLTPTNNPRANRFREDSRDLLEMLDTEKKFPESLKNLPKGTEIQTTLPNAEGIVEDLVLVKDDDPCYKYPVWIDDKTGKKYKINAIQAAGFRILK